MDHIVPPIDERCDYLNIFNQYLGECWFNSAIVALFLSDGIKDLTQNIFKYYNGKPNAVKYIDNVNSYNNLIWYNIMYNVMKSLHIMQERLEDESIKFGEDGFIPPLLRRQSSIRRLEESLNIGLNKMSLNYQVYIGTHDLHATGDPSHFLHMFREHYNTPFKFENVLEDGPIDLSDCNACLISIASHETCIFKCNGKWTYYDTMLDCDEYPEDEFEPVNCNTSGKTIAFLNGYEGNDLDELLKSFGEYIDAHPDDYRNNITLMSDEKYQNARQKWIEDREYDWNDHGGKVGLWLNTLQSVIKIKLLIDIELPEEIELIPLAKNVNNFDTFLDEIPVRDLDTLLHMVVGYYKTFYSKVIRNNNIQEIVNKILTKGGMTNALIWKHFREHEDDYTEEEKAYLQILNPGQVVANTGAGAGNTKYYKYKYLKYKKKYLNLKKNVL